MGHKKCGCSEEYDFSADIMAYLIIGDKKTFSKTYLIEI